MSVVRCTCRPGALLLCSGCKTQYARRLTTRTGPSLLDRFARWLMGVQR